MRVCLRATGLFLFYGVVLFAQSAAEDPAIAKAKERLAQIQKLMDAGAASRVQLAEAQEAIADAEDAAILRKTIYGQDLTDAQSEEMIAAASRRYERRKQAFDKAKKLVDQGVATEAWLNSYLEEMYFARKE
jgi:outer membrane protein TolC